MGGRPSSHSSDRPSEIAGLEDIESEPNAPRRWSVDLAHAELIAAFRTAHPFGSVCLVVTLGLLVCKPQKFWREQLGPRLER